MELLLLQLSYSYHDPAHWVGGGDGNLEGVCVGGYGVCNLRLNHGASPILNLRQTDLYILIMISPKEVWSFKHR